MMRVIQLTVACVAILVAMAGQVEAGIMNGSFETGDFTGWVTQDLSSPFSPLSVRSAQADPTNFGFPAVTPTNGSFAAFHGFDGNGPGTIRIQQDITVMAGGEVINFDYRGGWDLVNFIVAGDEDRLFDVNVEELGGGANLFNQNILTAQAGTNVADTGALSDSVDLVAFTGQNVRLSFDWFVPNNFSGPASFQLDNITTSASTNDVVPEPSSLAIFGIGAGVMGVVSIRRRRREHNQAATA